LPARTWDDDDGRSRAVERDPRMAPNITQNHLLASLPKKEVAHRLHQLGAARIGSSPSESASSRQTVIGRAAAYSMCGSMKLGKCSPYMPA